jgi:hypothetical protein
MIDVTDPIALPDAPKPRSSPGSSGEAGRTESRVVKYLDQALSAFSRDFMTELSAVLERGDSFCQIVAPFLESLRHSVHTALDLAPAYRGRHDIDFGPIDELTGPFLASLKHTDVLSQPTSAHSTGAVRLAKATLRSFRPIWESQFESAKTDLDTEFSELNQSRATLKKLLAKVDRRRASLRKKRFVGDARLRLLELDSRLVEGQLQALVELKQKVYGDPLRVERPDREKITEMLTEIGGLVRDENVASLLGPRVRELGRMCEDAREARAMFAHQCQLFVGNATTKLRVNGTPPPPPRTTKIDAARTRMRKLRKRGSASVDGFSEFLAHVQDVPVPNDGDGAV